MIRRTEEDKTPKHHAIRRRNTGFHAAGRWWLFPLSRSLTFDTLPLFSVCTFANKIWHIHSLLEIWRENQSVDTYRLEHRRLAFSALTLRRTWLLKKHFFHEVLLDLHLKMCNWYSFSKQFEKSILYVALWDCFSFFFLTSFKYSCESGIKMAWIKMESAMLSHREDFGQKRIKNIKHSRKLVQYGKKVKIQYAWA